MRTFILALGLLLPSVVQAADISLVVTTGSDAQPTITAPNGGTSAVSSAQLADAEFARIIEGQKLRYPQLGRVRAKNQDGSDAFDPVTGQAAFTDVDDRAFIKARAAMFLDQLRQESKDALIAKATRDTARGVKDIVVTPR